MAENLSTFCPEILQEAELMDKLNPEEEVTVTRHPSILAVA
jgi:hypothetical protein